MWILSGNTLDLSKCLLEKRWDMRKTPAWWMETLHKLLNMQSKIPISVAYFPVNISQQMVYFIWSKFPLSMFSSSARMQLRFFLGKCVCFAAAKNSLSLFYLSALIYWFFAISTSRTIWIDRWFIATVPNERLLTFHCQRKLSRQNMWKTCWRTSGKRDMNLEMQSCFRSGRTEE